jgi:SnoaL-like domain
MEGRDREMTVELQRLQDRAEIIELIARYNKAYFDFDAAAYGGTAAPDGRYLQANTGWCAFGRDEIASAMAAIPAGGGHQHLCGDHIVTFDGDDRAIAGYNMFIYMRESSEGPNALLASGYYYSTVVRTVEGWRFSELLSFIDRKTDDYVVTNLRALVFSRPPLSAAVTDVLATTAGQIQEYIQSGRPLAALAEQQGVSEDALVDTLAIALEKSAPGTNPLPRGTARAVAHVLTHDQVQGLDVEATFRKAGWAGPAYSAAAAV